MPHTTALAFGGVLLLVVSAGCRSVREYSSNSNYVMGNQDLDRDHAQTSTSTPVPVSWFLALILGSTLRDDGLFEGPPGAEPAGPARHRYGRRPVWLLRASSEAEGRQRRVAAARPFQALLKEMPIIVSVI